jgi:ribulose-phosphate 3-epimerase
VLNDIRITPSILNANRGNLSSEIARIASVSDYIHLDVMDNIFVPNFTFDFDAATKIIRETSIPVDSHLMVADVDQIAINYAQSGSASVTFHV